ncbi:hypothetical protein GGP93_003204 [Salinibacter ruber]|nr:hypothetical protein [Salinibacter ruber]
MSSCFVLFEQIDGRIKEVDRGKETVQPIRPEP